MNSTLCYIFNNLTPVRKILLNLLKPSEIMSMCIVTGNILTDIERNKYMYPLKEIFHSLEWMNTLPGCGDTISFQGSDLSKLYDSRYKRIDLFCFIVIQSNEEPENSYNSWLINDNIHNGVAMKNIEIPYHNSLPNTDRVTLFTSTFDAFSVFVVDFSFIRYIIKDEKIEHNLNNLLNSYQIELELPFTTFCSDKVNKGIRTITIQPTYTRYCMNCRQSESMLLRIEPYDWIGDLGSEICDVRWRYLVRNESCSMHNKHDIFSF